MAGAAKVIALMVMVTMLAVDYGECRGKHHAAAPAPAVDCSSLVLNMADCLSFVSAGSTVNKPEGTCCSGLKTVLQTDATCLCEALKSSASLGVTLNVSKAMTLPSLCKLAAPSATNCNLSPSPSGAPELAPTAGGAETPGTVGSNELAPAPAPGPGVTASSSVVSLSVGTTVLALLLALFSSY